MQQVAIENPQMLTLPAELVVKNVNDFQLVFDLDRKECLKIFNANPILYSLPIDYSFDNIENTGGHVQCR